MNTTPVLTDKQKLNNRLCTTVEHVGGPRDELLPEAPDVVVRDADGLVPLLVGLLQSAHAVRAIVISSFSAQMCLP